tara:strand:- start:10498 stop:11214 length:717 start_codon:yes stop_codon:yes gene_type:complete
MTGIATAVIGSAVVGGVMASKSQKAASSSAAGAQVYAADKASETSLQTSQLAIDAQQKQFDKLQSVLSPYVQAGTSALSQQQAMLGLKGNDAQQASIDAIKNSAQFGSLVKTGEESILQNASATGGVRGGNTQGALAQYSPAILSQLMQSQYQNLGGLSSMGQASAAGVGNGAMNSGAIMANSITNAGNANAAGILASGTANAQNALAAGQANASMWGDISGSVGLVAGMSKGTFGSF